MKKIIMIAAASAVLVGCKDYDGDDTLVGSEHVDVSFSINTLTVRNGTMESEANASDTVAGNMEAAVDTTAHNGLVADGKGGTFEGEPRSTTGVYSRAEGVYSRATLAEESITDLYVWEGTKLLCHQVSTDADFGSPNISLTVGSHSLTFVASKSDGQTWADGQWTCTKVKDTFAAVKECTITTSTTAESVSLSRRVGRVLWTVEDAMPNATNLTIEVDKQCFGLDAQLNGIGENGYSNTINISQYAGVTGFSVGLMVLPKQTDGNTVAATFKVDALRNYTNTVTIVPNQICNIHGQFFSAPQPKATVTLSSDWGAVTNYDIR